MNFEKTALAGVYVVNTPVFSDERGSFCKTFNAECFQAKGLEASFKESYYSVSKAHTLRGMHYQLPPHQHAKLVYVARGRILDVVVDLRKDGGTYGKCISLELSETSQTAIYIPEGLAHGFLALEDDTITVYNVSSVYSPENDSGIRWDSFGFDWQHQRPPIVSTRDQSFTGLQELASPF